MVSTYFSLGSVWYLSAVHTVWPDIENFGLKPEYFIFQKAIIAFFVTYQPTSTLRYLVQLINLNKHAYP